MDKLQSFANRLRDALVQIIIHSQGEVLDAPEFEVVGVLVRNTVDNILDAILCEKLFTRSVINSTQKHLLVDLNAGAGGLQQRRVGLLLRLAD